MMRKVQAVYEGGILRPIEPLPLDEHQLVSVIILDDELVFAQPEQFEALADYSVTLEAVRQSLVQDSGLAGRRFRSRTERTLSARLFH